MSKGHAEKPAFCCNLQTSAANCSSLLAVSSSDTASSRVRNFRSQFANFATKSCLSACPKDPYQLLWTYSLRLLARKNYFEPEILDKLVKRSKKMKFPDGAALAARAVARFKELGLVNDERFFQNYFEYSLAARPMGKFGFIRDMAKRRIPFERAKKEWESRRIDEQTLALEFLEKRASKYSKLDTQTRRQKIASLLAGRGFSSETVWAVLDNKFAN